MILAAAYHVILAFFFAVVGILLMGVILLQRGKGVGLAGAFGGTGGHTAFGAKTGDFLMWVTVAGAGILLAFSIILNYVFVPTTVTANPAATPAPTTPVPVSPTAPLPTPGPGPMNPATPAPMPTPAAPGPVSPAPAPAPAPTPAPVPAPAPGGGTPPAEGSPTPNSVSWNMPASSGTAIAPLAIFGEVA